MLYKNHLLLSSAIALPIMEITNTLTPMNWVALSIGALLPDIDEPNSFIGQRTRGISDLIHLIFGHRGITHTIFFVFLIGLIGLVTNHSLLSVYLTLGVFLHILEDSFSAGGVSWLSPLTDKKYKLPIYTTGSLVEYSIGFFALIVIIIGLKNGIFVIRKDEILTIENMMSLVESIKSKIIRLFSE